MIVVKFKGFGTLARGDCLEVMPKLKNPIDLVLTDPPYGTTACAWDTIIPFDALWSNYWNVVKDNAAIVLTSAQPFTTSLIHSQMRYFKYVWTWEKNISTNFHHAKRMPLRVTEDIPVFYKKQPVYNPQKTTGHIPTSSAIGSTNGNVLGGISKRNYVGGATDRYPKNLIKIDVHSIKDRINPTQKPVALFEYLIKTYTNERERVLDSCAGSGTAAIAAIRTNRRFVCIEKDKNYFDRMVDRVETELNACNG